MKKIIYITPEDAGYGFRLAGSVQLIAGETDVDATLQKATHDPDAGMVVVDERLLKNYSLEQLRHVESNFQGIFMVLPSPVRPPVETEDYAARLIRQAIGYHVRLRL
jgi:V/A-type H+-transporting ATPase subunit F